MWPDEAAKPFTPVQFRAWPPSMPRLLRMARSRADVRDKTLPGACHSPAAFKAGLALLYAGLHPRRAGYSPVAQR